MVLISARLWVGPDIFHCLIVNPAVRDRRHDFFMHCVYPEAILRFAEDRRTALLPLVENHVISPTNLLVSGTARNVGLRETCLNGGDCLPTREQMRLSSTRLQVISLEGIIAEVSWMSQYHMLSCSFLDRLGSSPKIARHRCRSENGSGKLPHREFLSTSKINVYRLNLDIGMCISFCVSLAVEAFQWSRDAPFGRS